MKKNFIWLLLLAFCACLITGLSSSCAGGEVKNVDKDLFEPIFEPIRVQINKCMSWEEIIKMPQYKNLSEYRLYVGFNTSRHDGDGYRKIGSNSETYKNRLRIDYFDACLAKKITNEDRFTKLIEFEKFFISALEIEKKAGLGDYLNCISGDCNNGESVLRYSAISSNNRHHETDAKYEGQFKNAKRDGEGTMTYLNSGDRDDDHPVIYKGQWKDGLPSGIGTMTWRYYGKYVGSWKDGLPNGTGTMIYSDNSKYVGPWKDGKRDGEGTETWSGGSTKYKGQFKDDKYHGKGTYFGGRLKYIGQWKESKYHGEGTLEFFEDYEDTIAKYVKNITIGEINLGEYFDSNVKKYTGQFEDDKYHGKGTMTWDDGSKYTGQWENDIFHGEGTMTWDDGSKYVGQWKNGKFHGNGTLYNRGGKIAYKGTFHEGEYVGQ